ncbi:MAG: hypothetical protein ACI80M_001525 [Gammaproteobacteria bacterium]|jgi:hypothetical protein|tara:strand:+ start:1599 stop:2315 length:717 start_codon:yes stop_codon:yes gene_type:complete
MDPKDIIANTGKAMESKVVAALGATPATGFDDLQQLLTLKGDNTGYTRVWYADRIKKISSMSIDIMPGKARYFNLQIIPNDNLRVPRFVFEGLVMGHSSQVSVDLYPDMDMVTNLDWLTSAYAGVNAYYDELRKSDEFQLGVSRLPHMRTFCSPVFALAPAMSIDTVPAFEEAAGRYFDFWLAMFEQAQECDSAEAAARAERRKLISDATIALDPDRKMVVGVYGEELTQRIETAAMY